MVDIGDTINHYQVVEHIGRGGMADVWSARDGKLNRMVAIKTIARGLTNDGGDPVALFRQEAQTIAQMEHPHILPIYDFGDFEGALYIVMRYMSGGSLEDIVERGPMPPGDVIRVGTAVAHALDFAHLNNIVHLDLKPANILLDSYQTPYLADFGLATSVDREGRAANPGAGTLMYMAPEQLNATVIDKRADIYSFALVLYHMFMGDLPFKSATPLAFKQIQYNEDLPFLEGLPVGVSYALQRCANFYPDLRPNTLMEVITELTDALAESIDLSLPSTSSRDVSDFAELLSASSGMMSNLSAELLDAVDIYARARQIWDGGQGRFLLGVTHFMVMDSYYSQAVKHGLTIDEDGYQMILRGALEYDINVEYWWHQLDDANRRWVCLHTIRSANPPARIRALYRLETLPDTETPRIPRLVAQALQIETDTNAKLAALQVLGARSRLLKAQPTFDVLTRYRGRLLTTLTRLDVETIPQGHWVEATYTPEIDTLVADIALHDESPDVAERAARVIGKMRSTTGVRYFVAAQTMGSRKALRALAFVRDEAPNLPPEVNPRIRLYTWLTNTWRRATDKPLSLTWAFILATLGGWVAMGRMVNVTFRNQLLFAPQKVVNTIGFGLAFAIFAGVLTMIASEFPSRLRGFWLEWSRLVFSAVFGIGWGVLTWGMTSYMYFNNPLPNWDLMLIGGFGIAIGYVLTTMLNLRAWLALSFTAIGAALPVYAAWNNYCQQAFLCLDAPAFSASPGALIGLIVGLFAGTVLRMRHEAVIEVVPTVLTQLPRPVRMSLTALAGLGWATAAWLSYALLLPPGEVKWAGILSFVVASLIFSTLLAYALRTISRAAFAASAVAAFAAYFHLLNPYMQNPALHPTIDFNGLDTLFFFDTPEQIPQALIPFALILALGGHANLVNQELRRLIVRLRPAMTRPEPVLIAEPVDTETMGQTKRFTAIRPGGTGPLPADRLGYDFSEPDDALDPKRQTGMMAAVDADPMQTGRFDDLPDLDGVNEDDLRTAKIDPRDAEIKRLQDEDQ